MKKTVYGYLVIILLIISSSLAMAQSVAINTSGATADGSSILDITSTSKGLLIPRMTESQKNGISSPATGLLIYQTDGTTGFYVYNGAWVKVLDNSTAYLPLTGGTLTGTLNGTDASFSDDITANNITIGKGNSAVASNSAFGYQALKVNTTGYENTSMGYQSLLANTDGAGNSGFGSQSLYHNTSGVFNSAFGNKALHENTIGSSNAAIGYLSLYTNTTGDNNIGMGVNSLYSNSTGSNNVGLGINALSTNATGSNNTAIGYNADVSLSNLTNATAIGANANVSASNTIQLGDNNITDVITSGDITANGLTFGKGGGNISDNTASGSGALDANTSGSLNVANGYHALNLNTTGSYNTATGHTSLTSNTTGVFNAASGAEALYSNTTGSQNTADGLAAVRGNTTGNENTGLGSQALRGNVDGNYNTAVGSGALYASTSCSNNTSVGRRALYINSTGNNNTAIGYGALITNETGTENTAIGYQADASTDGLSNATAIGNGATVSASNTIQLGNGSVTDVITSGKLTSTGLVSSNQVLINTSTAGIYMLDVVGDTRFTGSARVEGTSNNRSTFDFIGAGGAVWEIGTDVNNNGGGDLYFYQGGTGNRMILDENGQLGLGTNAPSYALDVQNGDINASGSVRSAGVVLTSDKRLKRNIVPFTNSLGLIKKLNPVSYEKKSNIESTDYNKKEIGFIAQEIQEVLPNLVSEGNDKDKTLAVDYISLIPVLTKGLQEQQAIIEAQQKQIDELKKLLEQVLKK